jgi:selenocysteine lyase/cysteine desulfurase
VTFDVTVYGITNTTQLEERVPTCAFTLKGKSPRQVAEELDEANIYVWDGNYYALADTERLGVEDSGGMVRVGPVPLRWDYNTVEEIRRFGEVLGRIALDNFTQ